MLFDEKHRVFPVIYESVTLQPKERPTNVETDGRTNQPGYRDVRMHLKRHQSHKTYKYTRKVAPNIQKKLTDFLQRAFCG